MGIYKFHGGLKLDGHKTLSNQRPLAIFPISPELITPLSPANQAIVSCGDSVLKGQPIVETQQGLTMHAASSGIISQCQDSITIKTDGKDQAYYTTPIDYQTLSPTEIIQAIHKSGIVGLGGASFPTAAKLNYQPKKIETLVINAAECEPYITCDDLLIQTHPQQIITGIHILQYITGAKRCIVGIEDNMPAAYTALQSLCHNLENIHCQLIPSIYPTGGEKQLIKVLLNKEVPSATHPQDIGIMCQNVGTCYAIAKFMTTGEPLISRIVTITGDVKQPQNLEVRLGTPINELINYCGGYSHSAIKLMMGGPMMGYPLSSDQLPITPASNCILATKNASVMPAMPAMPCIRCSACADVCPAQLLPQQLYWHSRSQNLAKAEAEHLFDCIECGCCDYVCPSKIPLVQYYQHTKASIRYQHKLKQKADLARQRHQQRELRIARDKAERKAAQDKKKAALQKKTNPQDKQAVITAAIDRANAKKQAQE